MRPMVEPGDRIDNPTTGERIVFRKTSAETRGSAVVVETFLRPYAAGARAHVHPAQEERFEVLAGSVGFQLGEQHLVAGPGHRITVPAGTPHRLWNAGEEEARFLSEIRPALQFEQHVTALFALETAARTGRRALCRAVVAQEHFDTVRSPAPRVVVQRLGLALAASLGRLLGCRPIHTTLSKEDQQ